MRFCESVYVRIFAAVLVLHMTFFSSHAAYALLGTTYTPTSTATATTQNTFAAQVAAAAPNQAAVVQAAPVNTSSTLYQQAMAAVNTPANVAAQAAALAAASNKISTTDPTVDAFKTTDPQISQNPWLAYLFPGNTQISTIIKNAPSSVQIQTQYGQAKANYNNVALGNNEASIAGSLALNAADAPVNSATLLATMQTLLNNSKIYGPQLGQLLAAGQYSQAFALASSHPGLMAFLEQPTGFELLGVPAMTPTQIQQFYAAAAPYWNANILNLNGVGNNPDYGLEWGGVGSLTSDATANIGASGDNTYPDLARFAGQVPPTNKLSGILTELVIAVVAGVITCGAGAAAAGAFGDAIGGALVDVGVAPTLATTLGTGIAYAGGATIASTAMSVAQGQPLGSAFKNALVGSVVTAGLNLPGVSGDIGDVANDIGQGATIGNVSVNGVIAHGIDGAISGAASAAVGGTNIGKGALGGGVAGGLTAGEGDVLNANGLSNVGTLALAGAVNGAAGAALTGQNVTQGAINGAGGAVSGSIINGGNANGVQASNSTSTSTIAGAGTQTSGFSLDGTSAPVAQNGELDPVVTTAQKLTPSDSSTSTTGTTATLTTSNTPGSQFDAYNSGDNGTSNASSGGNLGSNISSLIGPASYAIGYNILSSNSSSASGVTSTDDILADTGFDAGKYLPDGYVADPFPIGRTVVVNGYTTDAQGNLFQNVGPVENGGSFGQTKMGDGFEFGNFNPDNAGNEFLTKFGADFGSRLTSATIPGDSYTVNNFIDQFNLANPDLPIYTKLFDYDGKIDDVTAARALADDGAFVYSVDGSTHFHDFTNHFLGYSALPEDVLNVAQNNTSVVLNMMDNPALSSNAYVQQALDNYLHNVVNPGIEFTGNVSSVLDGSPRVFGNNIDGLMDYSYKNLTGNGTAYYTDGLGEGFKSGFTSGADMDSLINMASNTDLPSSVRLGIMQATAGFQDLPNGYETTTQQRLYDFFSANAPQAAAGFTPPSTLDVALDKSGDFFSSIGSSITDSARTTYQFSLLDTADKLTYLSDMLAPKVAAVGSGLATAGSAAYDLAGGPIGVALLVNSVLDPFEAGGAVVANRNLASDYSVLTNPNSTAGQIAAASVNFDLDAASSELFSGLHEVNALPGQILSGVAAAADYGLPQVSVNAAAYQAQQDINARYGWTQTAAMTTDFNANGYVYTPQGAETVGNYQRENPMLPEIVVTAQGGSVGEYVGQKIFDGGTAIGNGWTTFTNWFSGSSGSSTTRTPAQTSTVQPTTNTGAVAGAGQVIRDGGGGRNR